MTYELHFYGGEDDHHVITADTPPQLTYVELRAGDQGDTVARFDTVLNLWIVPDVGSFTDIVICVKEDA